MSARPVEVSEHGTVSIVGPEAVNFFRLTILLRGLMLEEKTGGRMRLTRGPACATIVRRELGIRGKRPAQIAALRAFIAERRAALGLTDGELDGVVRAGSAG